MYRGRSWEVLVEDGLFMPIVDYLIYNKNLVR